MLAEGHWASSKGTLVAIAELIQAAGTVPGTSQARSASQLSAALQVMTILSLFAEQKTETHDLSKVMRPRKWQKSFAT